MRQININVTPDFERDLSLLMSSCGITGKTEAIRLAVAEAASRVKSEAPDFKSWIGAGLKVAPAKKPRFKSEDDLWL